MGTTLLWRMWEPIGNSMRRNVLMSKIYFGTNLKTPIEEALEEAESLLKDYTTANRETELDFWRFSGEKYKVYDADFVKKYYSEEDEKYIFKSLNDYWDSQAKED